MGLSLVHQMASLKQPNEDYGIIKRASCNINKVLSMRDFLFFSLYGRCEFHPDNLTALFFKLYAPGGRI